MYLSIYPSIYLSIYLSVYHHIHIRLRLHIHIHLHIQIHFTYTYTYTYVRIGITYCSPPLRSFDHGSPAYDFPFTTKEPTHRRGPQEGLLGPIRACWGLSCPCGEPTRPEPRPLWPGPPNCPLMNPRYHQIEAISPELSRGTLRGPGGSKPN